MLKILILLIVVSLSSFQCIENEPLNKSPIEIIECLYTSPIIAKDVVEIIDLFKQHEYIKLISLVIEKFPEIQKEVIKCFQNQNDLLLEDEEPESPSQPAQPVDPEDDFEIINYSKCIQCYKLKKYHALARVGICMWNCWEGGCNVVSKCSSVPIHQ